MTNQTNSESNYDSLADDLANLFESYGLRNYVAVFPIEYGGHQEVYGGMTNVLSANQVEEILKNFNKKL